MLLKVQIYFCVLSEEEIVQIFTAFLQS